MNITGCTKHDYDQIVSELADFWGHDRNRALHHPMFVNEFSNCAFAVQDQEKVVAYLFGFIAHAEPVAYVHLVAVRPAHRRLGLARQLYDHFTSFAVSRGCTQLRAITNPGPLPAAARGLTFGGGVMPQRDQHLHTQALEPLDPRALGQHTEHA